MNLSNVYNKVLQFSTKTQPTCCNFLIHKIHRIHISAFVNRWANNDENNYPRSEDITHRPDDIQINQDVLSPEGSKVIKAAVVGPPNVGKSTLINQMMGRRVFAISRKVHTTRCRARAVTITDETQLIFLDTPGLVTGHETRKYNLEATFLMDSETSMQEADIIVAVHDVSNGQYSMRLEPKLLRLLHLYKDKPAILILNKIDCLKSKRTLLDLADILTCTKLTRKHKDITLDEKQWSPKTEFSIQKSVDKQKGWPFFKELFMVSAIDGNGTGDIKEYLLSLAKPGKWEFPKNVFTDQNYMKIVEETVHAELLNSLPNEVPYNLTTQMEYFDQKEEGTITTVVLVGCKTPRIEKLVMGPGGKRIKEIAKAAEQELQNAFRAPVRLRVVVTKMANADRRAVDINDVIKSESIKLANKVQFKN